MRKLFNIFRKKVEISDATPNHITMSVDNSEYIVRNFMDIKIQSIADDVNPYGWSLEFRYKLQAGSWTNWSTYWNNHIYQSRNSAIDASIKIGKMFDQCEYRLTALYVMREPQYRNYKIDQLIGGDSPKKKFEIKYWKVNSNVEILCPDLKIKEGTIFIQLENGSVVRSSTPIERRGLGYEDTLFRKLIPKGAVDEIDIKDEKWLYPHLLKELKAKINKTI